MLQYTYLSEENKKFERMYGDDMLSYDEFNKEIIELYGELNLRRDEHHFDHLKGLGKVSDFIQSVSYVFPPAVGVYKGRTLEIAPSYYPYVISDIGLLGNVDDIALSQLNPSLKAQSKINKAAYEYAVIRMEMRTDIGTPSILIYPNTIINKLGTLLSLKRTKDTNYEEFNNKYLIAPGGQNWFLSCLNIEIMRLMIALELPKSRGAVFQFSKSHCTFSIVPTSVGKKEMMQIINILEKITNNIEASFKRDFL